MNMVYHISLSRLICELLPWCVLLTQAWAETLSRTARPPACNTRTSFPCPPLSLSLSFTFLLPLLPFVSPPLLSQNTRLTEQNLFVTASSLDNFCCHRNCRVNPRVQRCSQTTWSERSGDRQQIREDATFLSLKTGQLHLKWASRRAATRYVGISSLTSLPVVFLTGFSPLTPAANHVYHVIVGENRRRGNS
jgi:hypothetical protein